MGSAPLKSFLYDNFMQIFLWERIKGLKITPYPFGAAKSRYVIDFFSYLPKKLLVACLWFGKILVKKYDFLELFDDMNCFISRPYVSVPKGFALVMFVTDVVCGEDSSMAPILLSENLNFSSLTKKSLALLSLSIPF